MRETKTKRIGDFDYRVRQLSDPQGTKLLVRLTKIVVPTVAAGLKGLPDETEGMTLADLSTAAIGDALLMLSDKITEDDMAFLCDTLAADTEFSAAGGEAWVPLTGDKHHWSGRYLQKFQWIAFALEVNYADFLGGSGSIERLAGLLRAAKASKSPASSTGESNESSPASSTT